MGDVTNLEYETRNMLDTPLELNLAENRKSIHMICVTVATPGATTIRNIHKFLYTFYNIPSVSI